MAMRVMNERNSDWLSFWSIQNNSYYAVQWQEQPRDFAGDNPNAITFHRLYRGVRPSDRGRPP